MTALLDVEWLSGKRADPRLRLPNKQHGSASLGTVLGVTTLFVVVGAVAGLWSPLSQKWLREHGIAILDLDTNPANETLAMVVSLNAMDPGQSQLTVPASQVSEFSSPSLAAASRLSDQTVSNTFANSLPGLNAFPVPTASNGGNELSILPPPTAKTESQTLANSTVRGRLSDNPSEVKRSQSKPPIVVPVEQSAIATVVSHSEATSFDDLKQLPLERLLPLLGSTQERRVRLVYDELSQRGLPDSLLDIAIQFARGDEGGQLELLDHLARFSEVSPAPLLYWMAQSSSRSVRKRAIAILGSLQDRDVLQHLRTLATREPDSNLRQLIEQTVASNSRTTR
ncbi:HEAT repeat domain-containing protein [Pirellulaceae bacterium SH449]